MRLIKITYLFIGLFAAESFSENDDFYSMGRDILNEMVSIESTEANGLAINVSQYAESVLLDNGFSSNDLEVVSVFDDPCDV